MKNLLLVAIIAISTFGCSSTSKTTPTQFVTANNESINDGSDLYKVFSAYNPNQNPTSLESRTAQVLAEYICADTQYIPLTIKREAEGIISVYYIANTPLDKGAQFGRHYRVDYDSKSNEISTIEYSTKGCVLIPNNAPNGAEVAALFISHILADSPSEFHVFLSHLHNKEIYVGTAAGNWKINKSSIELM
ncbi:hypothetical protein MSG37_03805 [Shewanella sp. 1CM18E]|uniref:hypothetical protein n=1 Tax=Shewanella sp. 1CM18E TaxID=2929169 RepID=UPI0020BFBFDD|nr:hypothetical protein [Shewanella sp. 1CM18E]MCK8043998.1 hypothetical protein [Shewanella sp. 1CM18E]